MYIGIDPGLSGYIAILDNDGKLLKSEPIPLIKGSGKSTIDLYSLIGFLSKYRKAKLAVLEKVHAFPGQGVTSMFRFGYAFGAIETAIVAAGIPYILVTPQAWKKVMLAGENKDDKSSSVRVVNRMWPDVDLKRTPRCKTPDHNFAEAILLAEYGRKWDKGSGK